MKHYFLILLVYSSIAYYRLIIIVLLLSVLAVFLVCHLQKKWKLLKADNVDLNYSNNALRNQNGQLSDRLMVSQQVNTQLMQDKQSLQEDNNQLMQDKQSLLGDNAQLMQDNHSLQEDNAQLPDSGALSIDELLDRITVLEMEKNNIQKQLKEVEQSNREKQDRIDNQNNEIEQLKNSIKELNQETAKMQAKKKNDDNPIDGLEIIDDSDSEGKEINRIIDCVIDKESGEEINAEKFFIETPDSEIIVMRRKLQEAIDLDKPKYVCKYCGQKVQIAGIKSIRGKAVVFTHLRNSEPCDHKNLKNIRLPRVLIDACRYAGQLESERHNELKNLICSFLNQPTSLAKGIEGTMLEQRVNGNHPLLHWRKPDIMTTFNGKIIVFELQLSTTYLSVITQREMFYRLQQTHVIWVFNFEQNAEFLNLKNLMSKDIYYSHKRNIFVFDKDAIRESEIRGELVLKCNWLLPNEEWKYPNTSNSEINGQFITLSDLTFDDETYRPYYYDADSLFLRQNENYTTSRAENERSIEKVIQALNDRYKREQEKNKTEDENIKRLEEELNFTKIKKISSQYYYFAKRDDKWGVIDHEGKELVPIKYNNIKKYTTHTFRVLSIEDNMWTIIDNHGTEMLQERFRSIGALEGGKAKVENTSGKIGYIDCHCNLKEDKVIRLKDSIYAFLQFEKWGIKNDDEVLVSPRFSKIELFGDTNYFKAMIEESAPGIYRWGILRENGSTSVPFDYSSLDLWGNNIIRAKKEGLFGLIDFDNTIILPFEYVDISTLNEEKKGLVKKTDGKKGFIDDKGKPIIEQIIPLNDNNSLTKRLQIGKWSIYDSENRVVVDNQFDEIGGYRGFAVGINTDEINLLADIKTDNCRVNCNLIDNTPRGIICSIGGDTGHTARMNRNQLQKSARNGFKYRKGACVPLYITCIREDLQLIYVSAVAPKLSFTLGSIEYEQNETVPCKVVQINDNWIVVRTSRGNCQMIHQRILEQQGLYVDQFEVNQEFTITKTGFDSEHQKNIWKINL